MHYADYKTILSPQNGINLYRGCTHGCIYCDSRSTCYQMTHDFTDIEVKRNAPEILKRQLASKRKPVMIATGSMCDPYLPLEEELEITRKCLEVIKEEGFGVTILTKSALILRDLPILKAINEQTKCVVQMTLTTYDDDLCRKIEPQVAPTSQRVEVLLAMREAGIPTMVWLSPILPFINDTEENIQGILDYCLRAGVKGVICFGFGVTLREGNREYFYQQLDVLFKGVKQKYIRHFKDSYICNSPHQEQLRVIFQEICHKQGLMHQPQEVFTYLRECEDKRQPTLF